MGKGGSGGNRRTATLRVLQITLDRVGADHAAAEDLAVAVGLG
jgi:hypothetical protein